MLALIVNLISFKFKSNVFVITINFYLYIILLIRQEVNLEKITPRGLVILLSFPPSKNKEL